MVVVAAVLLVIVVALGVELLRTRSRLTATSAELARERVAREAADQAHQRAEAAATGARRERDDALDREKRAKREAADVARRLRSEHQAREAAELALEQAEEARRVADDARQAADAARVRLEADLAAAEAAVVAGGPEDAAALWDLALADVRRTWEISVAPTPGLPSPLEEADDELRAAIAIEVDAAREEAGAAMELEWAGDVVAPPAVSLRALSIARALIARLAKASEASVLRVTSDGTGVTIEVEGTDAEGRSVVPADVAAEHQVGPGRYVLSA